MDITVQMVAFIGILMTEIPTADSIAVIMDITITPEKDRVVCRTKAKTHKLCVCSDSAELVIVFNTDREYEL